MHVVAYHDGNGCCSVQWSFIMIYMVDAQYSGVFKRKKSEKLVLANDFYHIHHDNLPDWSW